MKLSHTKSVLAQNPDIPRNGTFIEFDKNFTEIQTNLNIHEKIDFSTNDPIPAQNLKNISPEQIQNNDNFE
ncbi:MAG: hypothetical protein U9Q83_04800 [Bacteroidota bacterium]|nr:hypothetical protein [Bacteroidota bacterium]